MEGTWRNFWSVILEEDSGSPDQAPSYSSDMFSFSQTDEPKTQTDEETKTVQAFPESNCESAQKELKNSEKMLEDLPKQHEFLKQQLASKDAELKELREKMKIMTAENKKVKTQKATIENLVNHSVHLLKKNDIERKEFQSQMSEKDAQLNDLRSIIEMMTREAKLEEKKQTTKMENLKIETQQLEEELSNSRESNNEMKNIISKLHDMLTGVMVGEIKATRTEEYRLTKRMSKELFTHLKNLDGIGDSYQVVIAKRKYEKLAQEFPTNDYFWIKREFYKFRDQHELYQKTVLNNLRMIRSNYIIEPKDLVPLPDEPALSQKFEKLFAQVELNEELERDCPICMEPKADNILHTCECKFVCCKPCFDKCDKCPQCRKMKPRDPYMAAIQLALAELLDQDNY